MRRSPSANGVHRRSNSRCGPPPSPNGAEGRSTPPPEPSPNGSIPRNDLGQFAKGYAGGPGNPYARRVAALRRAFHSVFTEDDMAAVARVMLKLALDGDVAAAKLLLAYAVGKPTPAADPDGLDFDELRLYHKAIDTTRNTLSFINALPAEVSCAIVQAVRPHLTKDLTHQLIEGLQASPGQLQDGESDES
jgi:hypothetical protein